MAEGYEPQPLGFQQITLGDGPSTTIRDQFCFVGNGMAIINMTVVCNADIDHNGILATNMPIPKNLCVAIGHTRTEVPSREGIVGSAGNFVSFWSLFANGSAYVFNFCYPLA